MAYNLNKTIYQKRKKPDIVFIGYPPIEVSYVMGRWLYQKRIPYVLDIKDQWPDLIVEIFPKSLQFLVRLALFPYYYIAKQTIKKASSITSMSSSFINWGLKISNKKNNKFNEIIPLVSDKKKISNKEKIKANKWCDKNELHKNNFFNILFLGSVSRGFDFDTLIECAKKIRNIKIKFIICGDGELRKNLIKKTKYMKNIYFTSWIDKKKIDAIAKRSSIAVAPYKNIKNFRDNIPNKIIDYLSYGLPILSPLGGEVSSLIKKYQIGLSYKEGSSISLKQNIYKLFNDKKAHDLYSNNSKKIYDRFYRYDLVYGKAVELIEKIYKNVNLEMRNFNNNLK